MQGTPSPLVTQRDLQRESFGVNPSSLAGEELAEYVRMNVLAATDELHEAMHRLGWKPWATEGRGEWRDADSDGRELYIDELVDVLHFVFNLLVVVPGLTWAEVLERYQNKVEENRRRRREGYRG